MGGWHGLIKMEFNTSQRYVFKLTFVPNAFSRTSNEPRTFRPTFPGQELIPEPSSIRETHHHTSSVIRCCCCAVTPRTRHRRLVLHAAPYRSHTEEGWRQSPVHSSHCVRPCAARWLGPYAPWMNPVLVYAMLYFKMTQLILLYIEQSALHTNQPTVVT